MTYQRSKSAILDVFFWQLVDLDDQRRQLSANLRLPFDLLHLRRFQLVTAACTLLQVVYGLELFRMFVRTMPAASESPNQHTFLLKLRTFFATGSNPSPPGVSSAGVSGTPP